ncbi:MAG: hypothetical protein IT379_06585, partial [Deltaproteobacteria bacterium]|nr:hypothetical protein [Deltaproteobacteria bacterium]
AVAAIEGGAAYAACRNPGPAALSRALREEADRTGQPLDAVRRRYESTSATLDLYRRHSRDRDQVSRQRSSAVQPN